MTASATPPPPEVPGPDAPSGAGLGLWVCTALVVGNMIGSGVFLLPSSLAPYGGISILGWLVSAGGAVCLALVFAWLGAALPRLGGPYAFAHEGFGDFGGFWVAWAYWISIWTTNAALAVAFISYTTVFLPVLGSSAAAGAVGAVGALWLLTGVNVMGVREAGRVQLVTTVLKLLPLVAVALFGFFAFEPGHFQPFNPSGETPLGAVTATVTLTLWAFLGLESGTVPAADVKDPSRTIPRATMLGTLIAAVVYIVTTVAVMGIIAPGELVDSAAPFADAAARLWGGWGRGLIAAGAAISCFGALNGWVLISGQVPRAAALDRLLPRRLARLNSRGTPAFGIVFSSGVATVLIAMNYTQGLVQAFTFLILLATLATLMPYIFSTMTAVMLELREGARVGGSNVLRLVVAAIAFAYSVVAVVGAGRDAVYWGFLLLLLGLPVYVAMRWRGREEAAVP
ncbi:MAG: amino acid permease [Gemmatimonadota bacterium]|jgi:APA family basic amino acid/polyamine antiporter